MADIDTLIDLYRENKSEYERFLDGVRSFFLHKKELNCSPLPVIHSLKWRLKDPEHLRDKLQRKIAEGKQIDETNLFKEITDFAGIRVLHLYQNQFIHIHNAINEIVNSGEWKYVEEPVANTWDPESEDFFKNLGLRCNRRDSY